MSKPNYKNNNKGKDNKSNNKGGYKPKQQCEAPKKQEEMVADSTDVNDSSYYYTDMQLRDQIMNFSFNEFLGRPIPYTTDLNLPVPATFPGALMAIQINPSVAPTGDPTLGKTNGVNLAGLKNYLSLSSDNAKTTNYGPEDVTALTLALAELIKMVSHASRAFGLLNYFDKRNWAAPRLFFDAMDIDFDDFKANAADYRIKLNTIIASIDKMPIPTNIKLLEKAGNWFQTVYLDGSGPMPQTYMFVPYSTWILDEAGTTGGSVLNTTYVAKHTYYEGDTWDGTFNRILTIIQNQVDALLTSSTMQYIFSDLLRKSSMGKQPLGNIAGVPDGYSIQFGNSDEIKLIIHNMVIAGPPVDQDWKHELYPTGNTGLNDVWCSAEHAGVIYNPEFYCAISDAKFWDDYAPGETYPLLTNKSVYLMESMIIDFFVEPDIEARVAATRLAMRGKVHKSGTNTEIMRYVNDVATGDAYAVHAYIYSDVASQPIGLATLPSYINEGMTSKLTDFNLYPILYKMDANSDTEGEVTQINYIREFGELNYFTMLDWTFMKRMYEAEMIGLFEMR